MLLAVDTSTRMIGIALYDGNQVLSVDTWLSENHHTVELAAAVQANLARVGKTARDIHALGAALGPGSFTGLRIGLAFVKGVAFTHGLPVMGVPTLDIVAAAFPVDDQPLAAVLPAGRNRLAVGWYDAVDGEWRSRGKIDNLTVEELLERVTGPTCVSGEFSSQVRETLREAPDITLSSPALSLRSPIYLAEIAWKRWKAGQVDETAGLAPIYLHRGDPIPG